MQKSVKGYELIMYNCSINWRGIRAVSYPQRDFSIMDVSVLEEGCPFLLHIQSCLFYTGVRIRKLSVQRYWYCKSSRIREAYVLKKSARVRKLFVLQSYLHA
jgi:hypothetical protein